VRLGREQGLKFMEQKDIDKEVKEMITPNKPEMLEAERKELFLKEYKELVMKHGFDFYQVPPSIIRVEFFKPPEIKQN
jgi:hypothetical protein